MLINLILGEFTMDYVTPFIENFESIVFGGGTNSCCGGSGDKNTCGGGSGDSGCTGLGGDGNSCTSSGTD